MIRTVLVSVFAILLAGPVAAAVEVQKVTSAGGITAWLVEERSIPFAAIEIRFRGGTSLDAPGKRGAVHLMTALLEEGSGEMDARAFAEAREELAASIRFDSGDDSISVSFRFLSENRDASADLLRQALTRPNFDEAPLERVRQQVISGIRQDLSDPGRIASETLAGLAWGDHPYATAGEGTVESVEALTRDDIVEAHARSIARDRVYVGAVGDISPDELAALLDQVLGDLPESGAVQPADVDYAPPPGVTVVEFDTPQAVALFGHAGMDVDDPDFMVAYVVNEIMGGSGIRSRLSEEVRVKRGLTYGIGSYLVSKDHGAAVVGQVSTENGRMAETLDVVRAEWRRIADEGIAEEELADAKLFLTGAYPLRFDGNTNIAQILVGMQMDGRPIDYIANRNAMIEAVTIEDARRVATELYRPEALSVVIVGRPDGVEASN